MTNRLDKRVIQNPGKTRQLQLRETLDCGLVGVVTGTKQSWDYGRAQTTLSDLCKVTIPEKLKITVPRWCTISRRCAQIPFLVFGLETQCMYKVYIAYIYIRFPRFGFTLYAYM